MISQMPPRTSIVSLFTHRSIPPQSYHPVHATIHTSFASFLSTLFHRDRTTTARSRLWSRAAYACEINTAVVFGRDTEFDRRIPAPQALLP